MTTDSAPSGLQISSWSNQGSPLVPGAHLWITFSPEDSRWTQRLDWYLNFALAKWEAHRPQRQAPELKAILTEEELDFPESSLHPQQSIMISSHHVLPNQEVVVVSERATPLALIPSLVRNLNVPSARIFLSDTMKLSGCERVLRAMDWKDVDVELQLIPGAASDPA